MRTRIVQIEPHDDLISIKDKMNWGQTPRILLVWPAEPVSFLNTELDLVLLQRHAINLGAQLALVTRSAEARFWAQRLSIPVFKNPSEAQQARWRTRKRKRFPARFTSIGQEDSSPPVDVFKYKELVHPGITWVDHPLARWLAFMAGFIAILALLALIVPSASVKVTPRITTHQVSFTAYTSPEVTEVNPSGAIPSSVLTVIVEGRTTTRSSGTTTIGGEAATGQVIFTNLTDRPIIIPEKTLVRTAGPEPVRYEVLQQVELPAGSGATVLADVRAQVPGASGNIPAHQLTIVEGVLGLQTLVDNPRPVTGGFNRTLNAPTEGDRQRVYDELLAMLEETAKEEITARLLPGDILLTPSPKLTEIVEVQYTPPDDSPSDVVEGLLRASFQAQVLEASDLTSLTNRVLETTVPAGHQLIPGTSTSTLITRPVLSGDTYSWEMQVSQKMYPVLNPSSMILELAGQPVPGGIAQLQERYEIESSTQVEFRPGWWPRFPYLPFRIYIEIEQPAGG